MGHFDFQKVLRDELGELKSYSPVLGKYDLRLDANEAPEFLSAGARKRMGDVSAAAAVRTYSDVTQKALKKAIAARMGLNADQILTGVGSDEVITLLMTVATRMKNRSVAPAVLTLSPTFVMYRLSARIRGQRVMEVPLDANWDADLDAVLRAIELSDPNLIFIASPNNPTGTMVSEDRLQAIIDAAQNALVVIDEAYIDYADRSQLRFLKNNANVIILRTLSKIGFAGLRVGWMAAHPELVAEVDKARLPYNLPTLSQELATLALTEFPDEIESCVATVRTERESLAEALNGLGGIHAVPSQANFLWLELKQSAHAIFEKLSRQGVLVRSFHGRGGRLEKCLRVTIGTPEQNQRFLGALKESL